MKHEGGETHKTGWEIKVYMYFVYMHVLYPILIVSDKQEAIIMHISLFYILVTVFRKNEQQKKMNK